VLNLDQLNYNDLSKSKSPFFDFVKIIREHLKSVKSSYEEDIVQQKEALEKLQTFITKDTNVIKVQLDTNRQAIEQLISESETKLSVLKRLYNEAKNVKVDYFDHIVTEIERHITKRETEIKTYTRLKENFVSFDSLSEEEKQKRLEGYNKAILGNIEQCEKSISEYQHNIRYFEDTLSKL